MSNKPNKLAAAGAGMMGCGCLIILLFPLIMLALFAIAVVVDPFTH